MAIQFGTDGWRAVISEEFTFDNVRLVAQAIAEQTLEEHAQRNGVSDALPAVVIGYDSRFLSDRYAMAVSEVLAANGLQVWLSKGDTPTPLVSYAVVEKGAAAGVMITASHNPPRYNGIKLKAHFGGGVSGQTSKAVAQRVAQNQAAGRSPLRVDGKEALAQGHIRRFDPLLAYREHVRRMVDFDAIRRAELTVAVDAMHGSGRTVLRRMLEEADCRVVELRGEMNPGFNGVHPEPIARNLHPLMAEMMSGRFILGLATDGDADRIGAMAPGGRFIDPHAIMALLTDYLIREKGLRGAIVKTVSTTQMLNRLAAYHGLPIHETPVGFNHISDLMLTEDVLIGGEESGGISVKGHIPEGDGVLMGLLLAELVAVRRGDLGALLDELMARPYVGSFCYARNDRAVPPFNKTTLVRGLMSRVPATLAGQPIERVSDGDGVKYILADNSWLLIRPSGTEPVLRIYAEAPTDDEVADLLQSGGDLAEAELASL